MPARKKSSPSSTLRLVEEAQAPVSPEHSGAPSQSLMSRLRVLYFHWDLQNGDFVDLGGAVEPILGFTPDEILSVPHMTEHVLHPDFSRRLPGLMAKWSLEHADHLEFEAHCVAKDGREVWLLVSGAPEYAADGAVVGLKAFAQEATGLALARSAAEDGRQLYTHLFRNAPMPLILFDPDTLLVVDANAFACAAYGLAHPDFCGTFFDELVADEQWPRREERLRASPNDRPVHIIPRMIHRKADGTTFPVQVVIVDLHPSGRSTRLAVVRDLTEAELAESSLRVMRTALQGADSPVLLLDGDERVFFANPAGEKLCGFTFPDMQGQQFPHFLAKGWERTWKSALGVARRGGAWRGKLALHGLAEPREVLVELVPVYSAGASASHFIALLHPTPEPE